MVNFNPEVTLRCLDGSSAMNALVSLSVVRCYVKKVHPIIFQRGSSKDTPLTWTFSINIYERNPSVSSLPTLTLHSGAASWWRCGQVSSSLEGWRNVTSNHPHSYGHYTPYVFFQAKNLSLFAFCLISFQELSKKVILLATLSWFFSQHLRCNKSVSQSQEVTRTIHSRLWKTSQT